MKRLTFCLLLLLSTGACAEDIPWYTVEMIIFGRTDPGAGEFEHWPYDPGFPELTNAIELDGSKQAGRSAGSTSTPITYRRISRDQLTLGKARKKIDKSSRYELLLHVGWRQQGLDRKASKPVHVRSSSYPLPPPTQQHPYTDRLLQQLATVPSVEGAVRIYRTRYLHFEADLLYFRPRPNAKGPKELPPEEPDEELYLSQETIIPTHFRLTESRRMRSRELHYLDHPLFGILVEIRPYEVSGE